VSAYELGVDLILDRLEKLRTRPDGPVDVGFNA
jgi:hypothetical protein